jgi:hypothetical protein
MLVVIVAAAIKSAAVADVFILFLLRRNLICVGPYLRFLPS